MPRLSQVIGGQTVLTAMKQYLTNLSKREEDAIPEWRQYHTIYISNPLTPICYDTHNKDIKRIRDAAGITGKRAVTHFHRSDKPSHAIENNVNTRDIESAVGWHLTSEGQKTYLKGALVTPFVLAAGKWKDSESFFCSWESDGKDIPDRLLSKVFAGLDDITAMITQLEGNGKVEVNLAAEKNTVEVFTYLRKVFLEDAVYLLDLYPDWPVYSYHPVFKDPLWAVYKAAETERVASRHKQFVAGTTIGQLSHGLRELKTLLHPPKKQKRTMAAPTFTEEDIQAAVDAMAVDEPKPFVEEPTDIMKAYKQHTDIWQNEARLDWTPWFGPNAKVNGSRYTKCVDMYKYIDALVDAGKDAREVVEKLVKVAAALKVSQSCLVKNIFYFYHHPPSPTATHQPLFSQQHIEATFATCGLPLPV